MAKPSRRKPAGASESRGSGRARQTCSTDIYTGAEKMTIRDLNRRNNQSTVTDSLKAARAWYESNWFIETATLLRTAFFNFGLRFTSADPSKREALKKWLEDEENGGRNEMELREYVEDVWNNWSIQDNVVSFWLKGEFPWLLRPEDCEYSNRFGIEKLKVNLGLKKADLADGDLDTDQIERYTQTSGFICNNEDANEQFRVLTRQMRFHGFAYPRMKRVSNVLMQCESMEAGENMLGFASRRVVCLHPMGFEVRSATGALKQAEYLWKKTRSDGILKEMRGKVGFFDMTTQFDHKPYYLWVDPKLFDNRKWATIIDRLVWWSGPAGMLAMAKQPSPHLADMLRTEARANRKRMKGYLEHVINSCGVLGKLKIRIVWSEKCFNDPRLMWDMTKTLLTAGPLSATSALKAADYDEEEELSNKKNEKKNPEDYMPLFDHNHGNRPGAEKGGRKPGTRNGDEVKP